VYNKTLPDDDFIKSKHVIETQVFLLVVLTDKIKSIGHALVHLDVLSPELQDALHEIRYLLSALATFEKISLKYAFVH
jgi:hypothetical protein